VVNGEPRSLTKTKGDDGLSVQPAQGPQLVALDRVGARGAVLDPPDVKHRAVEVDLVPAEVADVGCPQAVPVGEQDNGGVAVTIAVAPGRLDQRLDLVGGEVLSGPQVGVLRPLRRNCS
jgi:hypothetical protein